LILTNIYDLVAKILVKLDSTLNLNGTFKKTKSFLELVFVLFTPIFFASHSSFASVNETYLVSFIHQESILTNGNAFSANVITVNLEESEVSKDVIYVAEGTILYGFDKISNVTVYELTASGSVSYKEISQPVPSHKFTVKKCNHKAHRQLKQQSNKEINHTCFISKRSNKTCYWTDLGIQKEAIYSSSSFSDFLSENIATASFQKLIYSCIVDQLFYSIFIFHKKQVLVDTFRRGPPINEAFL
jgi:hypothetical protein